MQFDCHAPVVDIARHAAARVEKAPAGGPPVVVGDGSDELALEVTCGQNTACLYMSRLQLGSKGTCVLFDNAWLTPNEFQYVSGRETAKDWKRSIKHFGKSLKVLIAKGILLTSPVRCNCGQCGSPKDKSKSREEIRPVAASAGGSTVSPTKPSHLLPHSREGDATGATTTGGDVRIGGGQNHALSSSSCNVPEDRSRAPTGVGAGAGAAGGGVCHQISAISPVAACQKSSTLLHGCSLGGDSFLQSSSSSACKESSKKIASSSSSGISGGGAYSNGGVSGAGSDVGQQHDAKHQGQNKSKRTHSGSATSSSGQQNHHHHHHHHKTDGHYSSHNTSREDSSRNTSSVNKSGSAAVNDSSSCSKSTKPSSSSHHSSSSKSFTETNESHHQQRNTSNNHNNNNNNNTITNSANTTAAHKSQEKSKEQQQHQQSLQHTSSPHYNATSNISHGASPSGNGNSTSAGGGGVFEPPFFISPYYPMLATPQLPPYYNNPYVMWPAMSAASAFTTSASAIPYSWTGAPSAMMSESAQDGCVRSFMNNNNNGKTNNASSCAAASLPMFSFPWMKRPYASEASPWSNIVPGIAPQFRSGSDALVKHKMDHDDDVPRPAKQPCIFPNDTIRPSFFGEGALQDAGMNALMPCVYSSYIPPGAAENILAANSYMKGGAVAEGGHHYDSFNRYPNWFSSPFVGMSTR